MWLLFGRFFIFIKQVITWSIQGATSLAFKYPIFLAYVASVIALYAIFYVAISALLLSLNLVFPTKYLDLVAPILPTNLKTCFALVLAVRFIVLSLTWTLKFKSEIHKMAQSSAGRN